MSTYQLIKDLEKAANLALEIRSNEHIDMGLAIYKASQYYNVRSSDVSKVLLRRRKSKTASDNKNNERSKK